MKIGIDGRALQFRSWGGVRHYTLELLQTLFKLDHENEYHVFYNAWKKIEVPRFAEFSNLTVHYSRWPNKLFNLSIKLFGKPAFHIAGGTLDILFVPNLNFVAPQSSTKLIAVAHDLSFEHFPEYFSWRFRAWHRALNPRALFSRADHLIAVSEHTKGDLIETYGMRPEKVTVVYPGMSPIRHPERPQGVEGSLHPDTASTSHGQGVRFLTPTDNVGVRNDTVGQYILYLGALEPRKNIEGIIKAYEILKPREALVLAGLFTPYVKHLKKRIVKSKFRDHIQLIENPSEEEKHALYAGAKIFVYPSFYEGFGFPPLEAMAAGVPVVASSASSVPEICGDAALLVSPWKSDEIKEGMRILLEDEEMRKRYIEAGYARVKMFAWDGCATQVLKVIHQVGESKAQTQR